MIQNIKKSQYNNMDFINKSVEDFNVTRDFREWKVRIYLMFYLVESS